MILGLLFVFLHFLWVHLAPSWALLDMHSFPMLLKGLYYIGSLNGIIPITDGILPILGTKLVFFNFLVAKKILTAVVNLLRGSGIS